MRRLLQAMIITILIAISAGLGAYHAVTEWSKTPVELHHPVVVLFEPGTALARLSTDLHQLGVIDSDAVFHLYVRLVLRNYKHFQSGSYRFEKAVTPDEIIHKMIRGEVFRPVLVTISVPEGFTLKSLIDRLAAHGIGTISNLRTLVRDPAFLKQLQIPGRSLEGYVYPATYPFYTVPSAEEALTEMVKTFWQNLPPNYETRTKSKGLTLHQAVTFASLIELETQTDDERPLVSEVIWRRLKDKAPIGIDAAIIYGIPDYAGDLKWSHLSDAMNPYNTRIHKGLPPGPIGSPSRASLEAVLTPANEGYYYYVLKAGTKRHHFSRSLAEHNQHVKELIAALRTKGHDTVDKSREPSDKADPVKGAKNTVAAKEDLRGVAAKEPEQQVTGKSQDDRPTEKKRKSITPRSKPERQAP